MKSLPKESRTKIGEFIQNGFQNGIYKPVSEYSPEGIKIVRINNYTNEGVKKFGCLKRINVSEKEIETFSLRKNDILINRVNSLSHIGKSCVIEEDGKMVFESNMMRIRIPDNSELLAKYLIYVLNTSRARNYFRKVAKRAVAQASINQDDIKSLSAYIPDYNQQVAIADLLSTWDEAIVKTERLIAAKEKRFSSLIFLLIHEHHKGWQHKKLSRISEIRKGEQLNRTELEKNGDYPAWNGGITPSGYTDRWNMPENTITISEGGNSCGFVNYSDRKFWCGGHCYALINLSEDISAEYLYFYLKAHEKRIMRLRVGSGLPNIQRKDLSKFTVHYPDKSSQKRIAETLELAGKEIKLLKKQAEYFSAQKRGLMQRLLTGKWRININREVDKI